MDTSGLRVAELWRYPVKSLGGERLDRAVVTTNGIVGDRVVHVRDRRDRVVTARNRPRLLALHGTLGPDGEPLIDGRPWTAPESAAAVREAPAPRPRLPATTVPSASTCCRCSSRPTAPSPRSTWTADGSAPTS